MSPQTRTKVLTEANSRYETIQIDAKIVSPQQLLYILERRLPRDSFSVTMQQDVYTIKWEKSPRTGEK